MEIISEKGTIRKLGFVNGNLDITCLPLVVYRNMIALWCVRSSLLDQFAAAGFTTALIVMPWILQWYLNSPFFVGLHRGQGFDEAPVNRGFSLIQRAGGEPAIKLVKNPGT